MKQIRSNLTTVHVFPDVNSVKFKKIKLTIHKSYRRLNHKKLERKRKLTKQIKPV